MELNIGKIVLEYIFVTENIVAIVQMFVLSGAPSLYEILCSPICEICEILCRVRFWHFAFHPATSRSNVVFHSHSRSNVVFILILVQMLFYSHFRSNVVFILILVQMLLFILILCIIAIKPI